MFKKLHMNWFKLASDEVKMRILWTRFLSMHDIFWPNKLLPVSLGIIRAKNADAIKHLEAPGNKPPVGLPCSSAAEGGLNGNRGDC
jgi:hypothetical protein